MGGVRACQPAEKIEGSELLYHVWLAGARLAWCDTCSYSYFWLIGGRPPGLAWRDTCSFFFCLIGGRPPVRLPAGRLDLVFVLRMSAICAEAGARLLAYAEKPIRRS